MRIAERALAYLAPACGIRCERLTENQQPTDLGAAELQEKLGRHFGKQQRSLDYFGTAFYIGFESLFGVSQVLIREFFIVCFNSFAQRHIPLASLHRRNFA